MDSIFCTLDDLKNLTAIGDNIDPQLLWPHVLIAQQVHIAPVLGVALYDDLVSRYDANQITGDTLTLWSNYVVPALAFASWYSAAPFLAYKTQRSGLATHSTDSSQPLTPEEMATYINRVDHLKTFYINRMENFLIDNKTTYTLYRQDNVNQSTGAPIFLGYKTPSHRSPYWDSEAGNIYGDTGTDDC